MESGGTVYYVYDLGKYATEPSEENKADIKGVLSHYHLNPDLVKEQLRTMCQNGQRKIALDVWFYVWADRDLIKNALNSIDGELLPLNKANMTAVVNYIATLKNTDGSYCYNEIQLHMFPNPDPKMWTEWKETEYARIKSFMFTTRDLAYSAKGSSPIKIMIDLGGELGGETAGQIIPFMEKIWKDYTTKYGTSDTYGFSFMARPYGRVQKMVAVYDKAGVRPSSYALDIYDNPSTVYPPGMTSQLQAIYNDMKSVGEERKPVLIQETYAFDPQTWKEIYAFDKVSPMNIRAIMQWQLERGKQYIPGTTENRKWSTIGLEYIYIPWSYKTPTPKPSSSPSPSSTPKPSSSPTPKPGDFNADGRVDILDFNIVVGKFGNPYTIFDYNLLVTYYEK